MTDPTIPELRARLRAGVDVMLHRGATRADLDIADLVTLLDALDHVGDVNKKAPYSPDGGCGQPSAGGDGLLAESAHRDLATRLRAAERSAEHTLLAEAAETIEGLIEHCGCLDRMTSSLSATVHAQEKELRQLRQLSREMKTPAHSPDGGTVVEAEVFWRREFPDWAAKAASEDGSSLVECIYAACDMREAFLRAFTVAAGLRRWRPISEPPSAEVHAWCKGKYLMRDEKYVVTYMLKGLDGWPRETWVKRWLPIPPSAGGSEEG